MQPGKLRHLGALQSRQNEAVGLDGQVAPGFADLANVYFAIDNKGGTETDNHDKTNAIGKMRIRIRWYDGVTTEMRLKWVYQSETRYYNIVAITPDRTHERWMCLDCERDRETETEAA